jgi:ABC-type hemin transport system substrate-binding protein
MTSGVIAVTSDLLFRIPSAMHDFPPRRIVCLTDETVETLYLLGEQDRIVGVSGYAVRPPRVRREKPRVSAFVSADIPKILKLEPDLVLAFSDLRADIVSDLIRAGVAVHVFNQRDIAGILAMIRTRSVGGRAGRDCRGAVALRYAFSTPHHSAMNSAVALVDLRSESRSTYSLKPCIAAPLAPKHRLGML